MKFLARELIKSFLTTDKVKIGFFFAGLPKPYSLVMASVRLRVYDIIRTFASDSRFFLEIYKPWKNYALVIFQKKFDKRALRLAQKLKRQGVKIVLDINVLYYDSAIKGVDKKDYRTAIMEFTELCDAVLTSSPYIRDYVQNIFAQKKVVYIGETIQDDFFQIEKVNENNPLCLVYAGYAIKALELKNIESVLEELHKKYQFEILLICEKNPSLSFQGIKTTFIRYDQSKIPELLVKGDIFLSPRDTKNSYNLGHSFTKIGYPMAVGLPVVADAIPSYVGSPALLCHSPLQWKENLEKLLSDRGLRRSLGQQGKKFCQENFSPEIIKKQYEQFFHEILL